MSVRDENHPRMIKAQKALLQRLGHVLGDGTKPLTTGLLGELYQIITDHRSECKRKGIEFPVLVALVVPRLGIVEFIRADLEIPSIRQKIVNFVREHPGVDMKEIVAAFRMAYPDLRPGDILEKHEAAEDLSLKAAERSARITEEAEKIIQSGALDEDPN